MIMSFPEYKYRGTDKYNETLGEHLAKDAETHPIAQYYVIMKNLLDTDEQKEKYKTVTSTAARIIEDYDKTVIGFFKKKITVRKQNHDGCRDTDGCYFISEHILLDTGGIRQSVAGASCSTQYRMSVGMLVHCRRRAQNEKGDRGKNKKQKQKQNMKKRRHSPSFFHSFHFNVNLSKSSLPLPSKRKYSACTPSDILSGAEKSV